MRLWPVVLLIAGLTLPAPAQDRSKKAYELMYEDVQLLKIQTQRIEKKIDQSAADLKAIGDIVRDLAAQFKDFQKFQARNQEGWGDVPGQIRSVQEQLAQIENRLLQLAEDLQSLKTPPADASAAPPIPEPGGKAKPGEKTAPAKKTEAEPAVKTVPPSGLSAQETYQAARADFSKGNLDLAVDGFNLYREQFGASPLADNALYMIGECRFSQKKYAAAIEAFDDLILTYPISDKIAAAYLKKGFALAEMKRKTEAVAVLRLLLSKYPLEEEAKQAQQKIKELQEMP
ncbi:MAG: tetratricopeptide repeat protein [Candidatus Aminicenantes bacterium]|nr:tetratricopeptide repeat protein [Candidatus Aminicenantes bacterium]